MEEGQGSLLEDIKNGMKTFFLSEGRVGMKQQDLRQCFCS